MSHGAYPKTRQGYSDWAAGVDGAAVAVPLTMGSTFVLYSVVAPAWLGAAILASCLSLVLVHLINAGASRPLGYSGRFFEAVTLAAVITALIPQFEHWGLSDSPALRVALMIVISVMAALVMGVLWLMRAERMVRFIPAPVFAAYTNSAALAVIASQGKSLVQQMQHSPAPGWLLVVTLVTVGVSLAVKFWKEHWPGAALGLIAGGLLGALLQHNEVPLETLTMGQNGVLPLGMADFELLWNAVSHHPTLLTGLLPFAGLLGVLLFLNSVVTGAILGQADNRLRFTTRDKIFQTLALLISGLLGATPVSGASNVSKAILRKSPMSAPVFGVLALVVAAVWWSGLLALLPLVALIGSFFFDAWTLLSKDYFLQLWAWVRRKALPSHVREDLLLISAVMLGYMTINIMAAMFIGLLLGLLLHADRNTRTPVRTRFDGTQQRSNCARSAEEFDLLRAHGGLIRVFQLDSNQFFASAEALQLSLQEGVENACVVVVDWSTVKDIDTSISLVMANLHDSFHERHVRLLHAGAALQGPRVRDILLEYDEHAEFCDDLDWALELAENMVIEKLQGQRDQDQAMDPRLTSLLAHLSNTDRQKIIDRMEWLDIAAGQPLIQRGEPSDSVLVLLQGQASVVVPTQSQAALRLAGVRSGSLIGEIGFLDRRERSATVLAETPVKVGLLHRTVFEELARSEPQLVQQLLTNISLDLANRLRNTNQRASALVSGSASPAGATA